MNGNNHIGAGPVSEQAIRAGIELLSARAVERRQAGFSSIELACHLSKGTIGQRPQILRQVRSSLPAMVRDDELVQVEDDFIVLDYFILPAYAAVTA
jgi:hypothetical protein